jgi:hypothetical protein
MPTRLATGDEPQVITHERAPAGHSKVRIVDYRLRRLMECARETARSPAVAASHLENFLKRYGELAGSQKADLFALLDEEFDVRRHEVVPALQELAAASRGDCGAWNRAVMTLRRSFASPRRAFLGTLANRPGGIGFVLGMREDMLEAARFRGRRFDYLDADMVELLEEWFCQGLLSLKEIDQRSPFQTIRFLHEHELVHPALRLEDMGRRVGGNRRCFALSHCATPDEPMVFVEVALRHGMAHSIHDILDCDDTAAGHRRPDTAIFYSINNAQPGLTGLGMGSVLIYRVVEALRRSVPSLDTFATLSPVPGFWRRFLCPLLAGEECTLAASRETVLARFGTDALRQIATRCGAPAEADREALAAMLLHLLATSDWANDESLCELLHKPLADLAYLYVTGECDVRGRPLDPVASFHLGNGARVRRSDVNFLANRSPRGIAESCTVMVNYVYSAAWYRQIGRAVGSLLRLGRSDPALAPRR